MQSLENEKELFEQSKNSRSLYLNKSYSALKQLQAEVEQHAKELRQRSDKRVEKLKVSREDQARAKKCMREMKKMKGDRCPKVKPSFDKDSWKVLEAELHSSFMSTSHLSISSGQRVSDGGSDVTPSHSRQPASKSGESTVGLSRKEQHSSKSHGNREQEKQHISDGRNKEQYDGDKERLHISKSQGSIDERLHASKSQGSKDKERLIHTSKSLAKETLHASKSHRRERPHTSKSHRSDERPHASMSHRSDDKERLHSSKSYISGDKERLHSSKSHRSDDKERLHSSKSHRSDDKERLHSSKSHKSDRPHTSKSHRSDDKERPHTSKSHGSGDKERKHSSDSRHSSKEKQTASNLDGNDKYGMSTSVFEVADENSSMDLDLSKMYSRKKRFEKARMQVKKLTNLSASGEKAAQSSSLFRIGEDDFAGSSSLMSSFYSDTSCSIADEKTSEEDRVKSRKKKLSLGRSSDASRSNSTQLWSEGEIMNTSKEGSPESDIFEESRVTSGKNSDRYALQPESPPVSSNASKLSVGGSQDRLKLRQDRKEPKLSSNQKIRKEILGKRKKDLKASDAREKAMNTSSTKPVHSPPRYAKLHTNEEIDELLFGTDPETSSYSKNKESVVSNASLESRKSNMLSPVLVDLTAELFGSSESDGESVCILSNPPTPVRHRSLPLDDVFGESLSDHDDDLSSALEPSLGGGGVWTSDEDMGLMSFEAALTSLDDLKMGKTSPAKDRKSTKKITKDSNREVKGHIQSDSDEDLILLEEESSAPPGMPSGHQKTITQKNRPKHIWLNKVPALKLVKADLGSFLKSDSSPSLTPTPEDPVYQDEGIDYTTGQTSSIDRNSEEPAHLEEDIATSKSRQTSSTSSIFDHSSEVHSFFKASTCLQDISTSKTRRRTSSASSDHLPCGPYIKLTSEASSQQRQVKQTSLTKQISDRTHKPSTQKKRPLDTTGEKQARHSSNFTVLKKKPIPPLTSELFYAKMWSYVLSDDQLHENGYPRPTAKPGVAAINRERMTIPEIKQVGPNAMQHECCRCHKPFLIYNNGQYQTVEDCSYHYGKCFKYKGQPPIAALIGHPVCVLIIPCRIW